MKRHSFFLRLFLGNLVIVVLAVAATSVVSYRAINGQYLRTLNAYQDNLTLIAAQHLEDVWPLPDAGVDGICKAFLSRQPGEQPTEAPTLEHGVPVRLTVVARDGRVLGDSHSDPARMAGHLTPDRPEVGAALNGRPGLDVRRSETLAVEYRYVAKPIRHNGEVVGAARIAMPVMAILENQTILRDALVWGSLFAIGAFGLIGLLINWTWYKPLRQVTATARQIASGDLTRRAQVSGPDELAQLGTALNAMRDSLARQIETISAQRENLEGVVANLREGVIALDGQGMIVLMNRTAVALLAHDCDEVLGRRLAAVVHVSGIVETYERAAATREAVDSRIEVVIDGERYHLAVDASPIAVASGQRTGILLVVHDVSALVRAAAMKAEFVANASHELRTPLATIRAAVEALQGVSPEDREGFEKVVGILARHVDRLEHLALDLMDLHAVETAEGAPLAEPISLETIEEWASALFAETASEKGVSLEFIASAPTDSVSADRKLVELILQNLIDNAIKFTGPGGRVTCRMERQDGHMRFQVADTGCGIRPEDQARVFERFFQADSARSGDTKARGTGLGLAIVKHAADRLGASVSLESTPGKGTAVTVVVPDHVAD